MANIEKTLRQLSNENTAKTFAFNASEAQKSRDFQEYMSNTSHQREVDDLKRAGLNPVLSANGGATAYSASSASGTADNSAVGLLASIYQTKLNNNNAVKIAKINANKDLQTAKINAAASKYASDNAYSASRYSADTSYETGTYSVDHSKYGMIDNFVKGVIGSDKKSNTASKIGKGVRSVVGKILKKYK